MMMSFPASGSGGIRSSFTLRLFFQCSFKILKLLAGQGDHLGVRLLFQQFFRAGNLIGDLLTGGELIDDRLKVAAFSGEFLVEVHVSHRRTVGELEIDLFQLVLVFG